MNKMFGSEVTTTQETTQEAQEGAVQPQEAQVNHPAAQALKAAQARLAVRTSELLVGWHDKVNAIRDETELDKDGYFEALMDDQRAALVAEKKRAAAAALHEDTTRNYEKAFEDYEAEAEEATNQIRTALFGLGDGGGSVLAQAVNADEAKLMEMLELSKLTGADSLGRAAFAAAVTRGDSPRVVHEYTQANPEAQALLHLYQSAPTKEWIEQKKAEVSRLVRPASEDQLASRPSVRPY